MEMENKEYKSLREKLIKLKTLSERGVENERQVAKTKLDLLLEKHNLSIDDITEVEEQEYYFTIKNLDYRALLAQIIFSVKEGGKIYHASKGRLCASFTKVEYLEVTEKYKYFRKLFKEQKECFVLAFFTNNELFSKNKDNKKSCTLSKEKEKQTLYFLYNMKKGEYVSTGKMIEG